MSACVRAVRIPRRFLRSRQRSFPGTAASAVSPDGRQIVVTGKIGEPIESVGAAHRQARSIGRFPEPKDALFPLLETGWPRHRLFFPLWTAEDRPGAGRFAGRRVRGSRLQPEGLEPRRSPAAPGIATTSSSSCRTPSRSTGSRPARVRLLLHTRPPWQKGETAHRWPSFLPDGQRYLYLALTRPGGSQESCGSDRSTGAPAISLGRHESNARYSAGHLLFLSGPPPRCTALRCETLAGSPELHSPVVTKPYHLPPGNHLAAFSVSEAGVLADTSRWADPVGSAADMA